MIIDIKNKNLIKFTNEDHRQLVDKNKKHFPQTAEE